MIKQLALNLVNALGPRPRAWIEYQSGHHRYFYPWGAAMNGQTARLEIVRAIIHAMQPARILETGTYRGTTTAWFAEFNLPVTSIEAAEGAFLFARRRLARLPNVTVVKGDSATVLAAMAPDPAPILAYLDAHWAAPLPLRAELQAVLARMPRAVVVIDDFQVPDDPGYGFDDYGPDAKLDVAYLQASALSEATRLFFPRVAAAEETGQRRGAAFLTADAGFAELLGAMPALRPWPLG